MGSSGLLTKVLQCYNSVAQLVMCFSNPLNIKDSQ